VLCEGEEIGIADLPSDLVAPQLGAAPSPESLLAGEAHRLTLKEALEVPERLIIERALAHHGGNRQETALSLGINRSTLFNKMRKYDLR
jgi:DNA-binding NtrC family response regulator